MNIELKKPNRKLIIGLGVTIITTIFLSMFNPFANNTAGNRQVVQTVTGKLSVRFEPGIYWAGPFSKIHTYPDVLTVVFSNEDVNLKSDIAVRNGPCEIRFNDAAKASAQATVRWRLPHNNEDMLHIHKEYKSYLKLAETALSRYTAECLKFTAQLMESETHYSGGMSEFSQDFQDQLEHGQYLIDQIVENKMDSTTRETERMYIRVKRKDENGQYKRSVSDIQQFNILLATATIDDINYEDQIDAKLAKKIEASTRESISKQNLITAQQEASTAEAEGKRKLVEIEYQEKQIQTQEVVQAETRLAVAEKKMEEADMALKTARLEAKRIKELADAEAYQKKAVMSADGALEKKLDAYVLVQQNWAEAFQNYNGALVPQIQTGGGNGNNSNALNLMDIMTIKAAKDLGLNMKVQE